MNNVEFDAVKTGIEEVFTYVAPAWAGRMGWHRTSSNVWKSNRHTLTISNKRSNNQALLIELWRVSNVDGEKLGAGGDLWLPEGMSPEAYILKIRAWIEFMEGLA
jgi:hypothetical protein